MGLGALSFKRGMSFEIKKKKMRVSHIILNTGGKGIVYLTFEVHDSLICL